MGVPEMHKYGLLSITTRWHVGSVDPEKSPKMDYFAAITTDHHYGRIGHRYVVALKLSSGERCLRRLAC